MMKMFCKLMTVLLITGFAASSASAQGFPGGGSGSSGGGTGGGGASVPTMMIVDYDNAGNPVEVYIPLNGVFSAPNVEAQVSDLFVNSFGYSATEAADMILQMQQGATEAAVETSLAQFEGRDETGFAMVEIGLGQTGSTVANPHLASTSAYELEQDLLAAGVEESKIGIALKTFVLDKKRTGKFGPRQAYVYVEDANGNVYYPEDGEELEDVLEDLNENDVKVKHLIIKGHACGELIEVGEGGDILIVSGGKVIITNVDDSNVFIDITDDLDDATDGNTDIDLRGCNTRDLAEDLDGAVGGDPTTSGSTTPVIGLPWSNWTIGPYQDF